MTILRTSISRIFFEILKSTPFTFVFDNKILLAIESSMSTTFTLTFIATRSTPINIVSLIKGERCAWSFKISKENPSISSTTLENPLVRSVIPSKLCLPRNFSFVFSSSCKHDPRSDVGIDRYRGQGSGWNSLENLIRSSTEGRRTTIEHFLDYFFNRWIIPTREKGGMHPDFHMHTRRKKLSFKFDSYLVLDGFFDEDFRIPLEFSLLYIHNILKKFIYAIQAHDFY